MEQQGEQTLPEVSGERPSVTDESQMLSDPDVTSWHRILVEKKRSSMTSLWVGMSSGCIVGISVEQWLSLKYPARQQHISSILIGVLAVIEVGWLIYQMIYLRKWKKELRADRKRITDYYSAQVDKLMPNDPEGAEKLKKTLEAEWKKS